MEVFISASLDEICGRGGLEPGFRDLLQVETLSELCTIVSKSFRWFLGRKTRKEKLSEFVFYADAFATGLMTDVTLGRESSSSSSSSSSYCLGQKSLSAF